MSMMTKQTNQNRDNGQRSFKTAAIKSILGDGNERKFELSFSSEESYERWWGNEILSHEENAVDLSRLNEIGVVLFNHDYNKVVGKIEKAWIEEKRGKAIITFDSDSDSETVYQKVKNKTLRGVSVGYLVNKWEDVNDGEISTDGFKGPCSIARQWQPLEISIVSVPADATVGVGRSAEHISTALMLFEAQVQINQNSYI